MDNQVDENTPIHNSVSIINEAPFWTRLARHILAALAKRVGIGYGLVPLRYPDWALKSARVEEYVGKSFGKDSAKGALHIGKATCYRTSAEEIREFQKSA